MLKWMLTLAVAVLVFGIAAPHLARVWRLGRLPGDVVFRVRGRAYAFPFTSTLVLSLIIYLVSRLL